MHRSCMHTHTYRHFFKTYIMYMYMYFLISNVPHRFTHKATFYAFVRIRSDYYCYYQERQKRERECVVVGNFATDFV